MGFAERLRQYREEKGISQKELSLMIGKSKNAISNYENHVSTPKIEDVIKIVETLDIEPNLLYWDDIPEVTRKRISDRSVNVCYDNLNGLGKKKADDYIKDLAGNRLYQAKQNHSRRYFSRGGSGFYNEYKYKVTFMLPIGSIVHHFVIYFT